jgi:hypothetical protein
MNLSQIEVGWLAGLFEGEGTFFMSRNIVNKKVYPSPRVVISMTDRDVIEKVSQLVGTKVCSAKPYGVSKKYTYKVHLVGKKAITFMEAILPLMGKRRSEKILSIISQCQVLPHLQQFR